MSRPTICRYQAPDGFHITESCEVPYLEKALNKLKEANATLRLRCLWTCIGAGIGIIRWILENGRDE